MGLHYAYIRKGMMQRYREQAGMKQGSIHWAGIMVLMGVLLLGACSTTRFGLSAGQADALGNQ
ncbi:MAG: hypothetical protein R3E89_07835 [Thiolinea sp.]